MTDLENHFTVFVRLPFKRGDFVDPPPVSWSAAKERELWDVISRQTKGNEIDWGSLAEQFQVTQQFLLQQAAWLYERQLSQVRAQMRRMGSRPSATASPVPGSAAASMVGAQPSKRPPGLSSRGPSRLSTQISTTTTPVDTSVPNTPARSRTSLPLKSAASAVSATNVRGTLPSSRPLSRKSSKDNESTSRTHSRRGSIQQHLSRSPGEVHSAELSSSEDENTSKATHRRPNPASAQRRASSMRKSQHAKTSSISVHQLQEEREEREDDEDEDDPMFLPFANPAAKGDSSSATPSDPSATLRSGLPQTVPTTSTSTHTRPSLQRNSTSERIRPATTTTTTASATPSHVNRTIREAQPQIQRQLTSSTSSLSSNNASNPPSSSSPHPSRASAPPINSPVPHRHHRPSANTLTGNLPMPLSPRQQAALAAAAGLSPRRRSVNPSSAHGYTGSESSPSMGSSFSDLDDASVTQSALEEALLSNMNTMGSTTGGIGGLGSRVSGISQALRSRYFDARAQNAGNNGNGGGSANNNGGSERG